MQGYTRNKPVTVTLALLVAGLAIRPAKILSILSLPFYLVGALLGSLFLHFLFSYLAALRSKPSSEHDPIVPLLSIATPSGIEAIRVRKIWNAQNTSFRVPLHPNSQDVSAALDRLIAVILQNHLLSWYTVSISPSDPTFPYAVERTIREALLGIRDRLVNLDLAKLGVSTLLPKITNHLELFQEAQQSILESSTNSLDKEQDRKKKQGTANTPVSEELDLLLSNKYAELAGESGLHPAVSGASFNSRPGEEKHLRRVIGNILSMILPAREGASSAVSVMAMEIVACAIIRPIIEAITDPDLWNRLLDDKAGDIIKEQRMVNRFRAALDANPTLATPSPKTPKRSEDISVHSSTKQFESYLRSLGRCSSLIEAKRIRNDIDISLRRARLPGAFPGDSPESVLKYIDRLAAARQAIDRRISELGGGKILASNASPTTSTTSLQDILHHPGALSFFMEFMDRRNRSLIVQFYLTVEGLKDPLEDDSQQNSADNRIDSSRIAEPGAAKQLADDVQLLLTSYLNPKAVVVDRHLIETLSTYYAQQSSGVSTPLSLATYRKIRQTIFATQLEIYDEMLGTDWLPFQRSDLFVKAIADMPSRTIISHAVRPPTNRGISEPEIALPSSASTSSKSSTSSKPGMARPTLGRPATEASLDMHSRPKRAMSSPKQPFRSNRLDFLTGNEAGTSETSARSPLFREESVDSPHVLEPVEEDADDIEQLKTMNAIHDALSSILASDDAEVARNRREASVDSQHSYDTPSLKSSPENTKRPTHLPLKSPGAGKPLRPLLHTRSASATSAAMQGELGELPTSPQEEKDGGYESDEPIALSRPLPASTLELGLEVDKITARLEKLKSQENVLGALLRKAELTGSNDELKLLNKSLSALKREMNELSFQQHQLQTQADDNRIVPGRTAVSIVGTTVGNADGKEFALYLVEVRQLEEDGETQISGWLVTRRFSEFLALHSALKDKIPAARQLELPQKKLISTMNSGLLHQRRVALERYLQSLIKLPQACRNSDFRAFLSQQNISLRNPSPSSTSAGAPDNSLFPNQGVFRNLFRTVTSGVDDFFGGPSMLDTLILRLSQQAADFAAGTTGSIAQQSEDLIASVLGGSAANNDAPMDLLSLSAGLQPVEGEGLTYFTAPIANLLVQVFDLKDKGSWLRRQAIVIILQQVLGGTIERKVREAVSEKLGGDALLPHIEMVSNMMYPDGRMRPASAPRTAQEKLDTRNSAYRKLAYLMPDIAASIIGRSNARRGARHIFSVMQNRRLNQHLIYTLLDDILLEVFGPAVHEVPAEKSS